MKTIRIWILYPDALRGRLYLKRLSVLHFRDLDLFLSFWDTQADQDLNFRLEIETKVCTTMTTNQKWMLYLWPLIKNGCYIFISLPKITNRANEKIYKMHFWSLVKVAQWSKWRKFVSLHYWRAPRAVRGVKNLDDQTEVHSGKLEC